MEKADLKSLVTQMYDNLIDNIDQQDNANKEQVIEYLRDSVAVITQIHDEEIDSIAHAKAAFNNVYQEIANKSISSYKHTNEQFEKLTQMHSAAIDECSDGPIDVSDISEKFTEIQSHMIDEVQKANEIITKLSAQVETLEKDSNLDSLTKVFNRRALSKYLEIVCSKKGFPSEFHTIMLDIDDFKVINDTYGHIAGDKILIFIANILKKTLRDGDKIFRYGGEEFVLILNRLDAVHCKKILHRLLDLISKNRLLYKGKSINVTVSIGSTVFIDGDTPDSLLARADEALYTAKKAGKNTIHSEYFNGN